MPVSLAVKLAAIVAAKKATIYVVAWVSSQIVGLQTRIQLA